MATRNRSYQNRHRTTKNTMATAYSTTTGKTNTYLLSKAVACSSITTTRSLLTSSNSISSQPSGKAENLEAWPTATTSRHTQQVLLATVRMPTTTVTVKAFSLTTAYSKRRPTVSTRQATTTATVRRSGATRTTAKGSKTVPNSGAQQGMRAV